MGVLRQKSLRMEIEVGIWKRAINERLEEDTKIRNRRKAERS